MKKLADSINRFERLLTKYPDNAKNTYEFYYIYKSLPLVNQSSDYIPMIEFGTILKYENPIIFHDMRKFSSQI